MDPGSHHTKQVPVGRKLNREAKAMESRFASTAFLRSPNSPPGDKVRCSIVSRLFLGVGVKAAYGGDFISEKFDARRPWVGHHKHIQDAASQGNLSFFESPLPRAHKPVPPTIRRDPAGPSDRLPGCFSCLRSAPQVPAFAASGLEWRSPRRGRAMWVQTGISPRKQLAQGIESFGDDIGVRQFVFMGQVLPCRIKQRAPGG